MKKLIFAFIFAFLFSACITLEHVMPPSRNAGSNTDTLFVKDESLSYLHFDGITFEDLAVQDIFQKTLLTFLASSFPFDNKRKRNDTSSVPSDYVPSFIKLFPPSSQRIDVEIRIDQFLPFKPYAPGYYRFYLVLPKSVNGSFVYKEVDMKKTVESIKNISQKYTRAANLFSGLKDSLKSIDQIFTLSAPYNSKYLFQPGAYLIAIPATLFDDLSTKAFHPENRYVVLNSNSLRYERDLQVFFFHFIHGKLWRGKKHFGLPEGFNYFLDSINATKQMKDGLFYQIIPPKQRVQFIGEFLHFVLIGEYGCFIKPTFVEEKKNIYRYSFFSEVTKSEMIVEFDLRNIDVRKVYKSK